MPNVRDTYWLCLKIVLVTVVAVFVVGVALPLIGYKVSALNGEQFSSYFSALPATLWTVGGTVAALISALLIRRYLKIGRIKKKVLRNLNAKVDKLDRTDPSWREELAKIELNEIAVQTAAMEEREDRTAAYGLFLPQYRTSDIDMALDALSLNGHQKSHTVLTAGHLDIIQMLSAHWDGRSNRQGWVNLNAYALTHPEELLEIEPVVARGIVELSEVQSLMSEKKSNSTLPLSGGWL